MKIRNVEAFQVQWAPEDSPEQRRAWVRIHSDDGRFGIGEALPMQGGLASLGIIRHNLGAVFLVTPMEELVRN
jgi:D-galactarolactone cycloisomerase